MKTLKQNQTDNHQKKGNKREDKKKTNIKFNSAIFFQIGLVIALVASAWAMNLKIGEKIYKDPYKDRVSVEDPAFFDFEIYVPKVVPARVIAKNTPPPVQRLVTDKFKVVDDKTVTKETKLVDIITVPDIPTPPIVKPPVTPKPPVDNGPKNINVVEFVPIFPGCESAGDNSAKIACLSDKIGRFVGRKFNTSVADVNTNGTQRINVQFKIDKNGNVVDIKASALDKKLQKEAMRVISKLPEFTPGKMGDIPVDVMYALPITFRIN